MITVLLLDPILSFHHKNIYAISLFEPYLTGPPLQRQSTSREVYNLQKC